MLDAKNEQVNAIDEKDLKQRFGVKKYPTLQYFYSGEVEVYTGARDLDSMVHFLDHMVRPRLALTSFLYTHPFRPTAEYSRGFQRQLGWLQVCLGRSCPDDLEGLQLFLLLRLLFSHPCTSC